MLQVRLKRVLSGFEKVNIDIFWFWSLFFSRWPRWTLFFSTRRLGGKSKGELRLNHADWTGRNQFLYFFFKFESVKLCNFCLRNKTHSTGTLFLNFEYKFFESVLLNSVFFSSEFRDVFDSLLEYSHSLLPVVCVVLHFLPVYFIVALSVLLNLGVFKKNSSYKPFFICISPSSRLQV